MRKESFTIFSEGLEKPLSRLRRSADQHLFPIAIAHIAEELSYCISAAARREFRNEQLLQIWSPAPNTLLDHIRHHPHCPIMEWAITYEDRKTRLHCTIDSFAISQESFGIIAHDLFLFSWVEVFPCWSWMSRFVWVGYHTNILHSRRGSDPLTWAGVDGQGFWAWGILTFSYISRRCTRMLRKRGIYLWLAEVRSELHWRHFLLQQYLFPASRCSYPNWRCGPMSLCTCQWSQSLALDVQR